MPGQSISEAMFFPAFKAAAAEGAAVELKMRLLAGKILALQKHAHKVVLEDIEAGLIEHFGAALSDKDKGTLRLCRQLRNKVLHSGSPRPNPPGVELCRFDFSSSISLIARPIFAMDS